MLVLSRASVSWTPVEEAPWVWALVRENSKLPLLDRLGTLVPACVCALLECVA